LSSQPWRPQFQRARRAAQVVLAELLVPQRVMPEEGPERAPEQERALARELVTPVQPARQEQLARAPLLAIPVQAREAPRARARRERMVMTT